MAARATPQGKLSGEADCTVIASRKAPGPACRARPATWAAPRRRVRESGRGLAGVRGAPGRESGPVQSARCSGVRAGVGRAPSVSTGHEGRGRLGPALPAAGRRRPALAAAAPGEVTRPPPALPPFRPLFPSPTAWLYPLRFGAPGDPHATRTPGWRPSSGLLPAPPSSARPTAPQLAGHHLSSPRKFRRALGSTGTQMCGLCFTPVFFPGEALPRDRSLGKNASCPAPGERLLASLTLQPLSCQMAPGPGPGDPPYGQLCLLLFNGRFCQWPTIFKQREN